MADEVVVNIGDSSVEDIDGQGIIVHRVGKLASIRQRDAEELTERAISSLPIIEEIDFDEVDDSTLGEQALVRRQSAEWKAKKAQLPHEGRSFEDLGGDWT